MQWTGHYSKIEAMTEDKNDPALMEALEWFVRLRDEHATPADQQAFDAWRAADTAHAEAWRKAETLWRRFDIAQPEFERFNRQYGGPSRRHVLTGAALLLGAAAGGYTMGRPWPLPQYTTAAGQRRTIRLPDGSSVEMGSSSALSTHFSTTGRMITLHRGEGFFDVTYDAATPFTITAANGFTQTAGMQCDIKNVGGSVTVTAHRQTASVTAAQKPPVAIEAGWQISYDADGLGAPRKADLDTAEAWRKDRIVFQDAPLRRVLLELERYRHGRIVLMNHAIGNIPVTAIFDTRQTDDALQTIASSLPVRLFHVTRYLVMVYSTA